MAQVLVRLAGVRKTYGAVIAVASLSLDVLEGEFFTLLGPSGSGKSTTLMLIAGFERPTAGDILFRGEPVTSRPPNRRDIGMVFQNYALFPHMTVFDNVGFPLRMRKVPRGQRAPRVREMLATVGLPGMEARYPRQLSGGQQQRVALARALVCRPSLLLLDEPLGALDRKLREDMQAELKAIQREVGVTTLYVTHDQQEALGLSDRIAIMDHGRIAQVGTPLELYERPADRFVASFLGDVNLLAGTVAGGEAGSARVRLPGGLAATVEHAPPLGADVAITLAIRPERFRLDEPGAGPAGAWPGTVRDVVFVGELVRYTVEVAPGLQIRAASAHLGPIRAVGTPVAVSASPRDWQVIGTAAAPRAAPAR